MSTLVALRATRVVIGVGSKGSKGSRSSKVHQYLRTFAVALALLIDYRMTAKDFTELVAWQRADELEQFALEIIKRPRLARDRDYCAQTSDAASSAPRNIAEGFGRFAPIQNANFVRIAIGRCLSGIS